MKEKKEVLIILPAYNEEKTIMEILNKLEEPPISEFADVLVINDASEDETSRLVHTSRHKMVTNTFNLGYGGGLQIGYKYALRRGYQYVIQMDADGQHAVENVVKIYEALQTKDTNGKYPDIVLGSRFLEGSVTFSIPILKKIAFSFFRGLIRLGTGHVITDPTSGLQGLSRRAFLYYSQYGHFDDRYPDANMLMQMLLLGFSVEEIPAIMYARIEGTSMHSGLKPVLYMFRMLYSMIAVWVRVKIFKVGVGVADEKSAS